MAKAKEKKYVINRQQILRILRQGSYHHYSEKHNSLYQQREDREKELKKKDPVYRRLSSQLKAETRRCNTIHHIRERERKLLLAEFITTTKCSPAFLGRLRKHIGEKT